MSRYKKPGLYNFNNRKMIFVLQCLRAPEEKAACSGGCWITNEPFALGWNDK